MNKNLPEMFISYSKTDLDFVQKLMNELDLHDVPYWSDQKIKAGTFWMPEIESAMKRADLFVLIISPNFEKSDYALLETGIAVGRAQESGAMIVPILLHGASTPPVLSGFKSLEADKFNIEQIVTQLQSIAAKVHRRPEPAVRELSLFVSSPADVTLEREIVSLIVEELNTTIGKMKKTILQRYTWERFAPIEMGHPQPIMNEIIRDIDVFVLILGARLGTPVGIGDGSRTEDELQLLVERRRRTGQPQILCYLKKPYKEIESAVEVEQREKVLKFSNRLRDEGLVFEFTSIDEFESAIRNHLTKIIESA